MESVDELCQDANKFNNYLRNVARQQQQKVAFIQRQVKQNDIHFQGPLQLDKAICVWYRQWVFSISGEKFESRWSTCLPWDRKLFLKLEATLYVWVTGPPLLLCSPEIHTLLQMDQTQGCNYWLYFIVFWKHVIALCSLCLLSSKSSYIFFLPKKQDNTI